MFCRIFCGFENETPPEGKYKLGKFQQRGPDNSITSWSSNYYAQSTRDIEVEKIQKMEKKIQLHGMAKKRSGQQQQRKQQGQQGQGQGQGQQQGKERRKNIRGKPIDIYDSSSVSSLNESIHNLSNIYPKSKHDIKFLNKCIESNFIFSDLTQKDKDILIQAMQSETISDGTIIIKQGDVGDYFYIVNDGIIDFYVKQQQQQQPEEEETEEEEEEQEEGKNSTSSSTSTKTTTTTTTQHVGSCTRGECFGELALLYDCPRAATCICASSSCTLWKVDQTTFRTLLAHRYHDAETQMMETIKNIPLIYNAFQDDETKLAKFCYSLTPLKFVKNERIVHRGDIGEAFYIIESGSVKVHDIGLGSGDCDCDYSYNVDQILSKGQWFGERSLLTGERRAANVTAISDEVHVGAIDRETFIKVFGDYNYINTEMKKNFLKSLPLFATNNNNKEVLDELVDHFMKEICYNKGDKLIELGKVTTLLKENSILFIRHGKLVVYEQDGIIYNLETGDHYLGSGNNNNNSNKNDGKKSSKSSKTLETVICEEDNTTCWAISWEDIHRVMGNTTTSEEDNSSVSGSNYNEQQAMEVVNQQQTKVLTAEVTLSRSQKSRRTRKPSSIALHEIQKHTVLGQGAYGLVWLTSCRHHPKKKSASSTNSNTTNTSSSKQQQQRYYYALKMVPKCYLINTRLVQAIIQEKNLLSSLCHPFIIHLQSSYQDRYYIYLLLDLIQGGELFHIIYNTNNQGHGMWKNIDHVKFYAGCILLALGYMHERNICYRDLKPENILIDQNGYCIIIDLGFAKIVPTKTYTLCGTPEYLAPEIITSRGHNKAVDYWSFGVLLYEMLAGYTPYIQSSYNTPKVDQTTLFRNIVLNRYQMPKKFYNNNNNHHSKQKQSQTMNNTSIAKNNDNDNDISITVTRDSHSSSGSTTTTSTTNTNNTNTTIPPIINLISRLLEKNPMNRLGNLRCGYHDITNHPWFNRDKEWWTTLLKKQIPIEQIPWIPNIHNALDSHYYSISNTIDPIMFEKQFHLQTISLKQLTLKEQNLFQNF